MAVAVLKSEFDISRLTASRSVAAGGDLTVAVGVVVFDPEPSFTNTGLKSSIPTVNFINSAAFDDTRSAQRYSASFSL